MDLEGRVAVVTGAAGGLGLALAQRFAADGARLVLCDLDGAGVHEAADAVGALGVGADVTSETDVRELVGVAEAELGPVDLFCSNAGGGAGRDLHAGDEEWERGWKLNVLSHVYAARSVLPSMLDRGDGYLLQVVSSVALAIQPDALGYSATKRAALAVNEWLAIRYRPRGIGVSAFCPQGMLTPMLLRGLEQGTPSARIAAREAVTPEEAADAVALGIRDERFLILAQQRPLDELRRKGEDYDAWIRERSEEYLTEANGGAGEATSRSDTERRSDTGAEPGGKH